MVYTIDLHVYTYNAYVCENFVIITIKYNKKYFWMLLTNNK